MSLPDDDSDAFRILVQWIYISVIPTARSVGVVDVEEKDCLKLVKAYCLGDKFQIPQFKIDALKAVDRANISQLAITPECITCAFGNSMRHSSLTKLLVDILATSVEDKAIELKMNTPRSTSNDLKDMTWSDFFELGGEFVHAFLGEICWWQMYTSLERPFPGLYQGC